MARPLIVTDEPSREDVRFLGDRLYEYNVAATGFDDGRALGIFVRDDADALLAGLYGWTWGGCGFVDKLWVHPDHRGRGLGRRLMETAEAEIRARGAFQLLLLTHSFQAPAFYEGLGFERVGAFDDYPRGHQDVLLRKTLGRVT